MEIVQEKNKRTGLIVTILLHVVLVLLFAFYGLTYLDPPPEEEGITINFGTTNQGMMTEQNNTPSQPKESVPPPVSTPTEEVQEEILTQDSEDAPVVNDEKEEEKVEEEVEEPTEEVEEEPQPDKNLSEALNKWQDSKKNSNTSGGDGETDIPGDQGAEDGDKNSSNYDGGGAGNGTSFSLSGRKMLSSPKIEDQSQVEGKVVVNIIVDRYGNVIRANPGARGSTTANSLLYKKAKEAALNTKFNPHPDAAEEQKGQMTFIFRLN